MFGTVVPYRAESAATQAVGVDFDLTLIRHDQGWQDGRIYGQPIPGALESLRALLRVRAVFIVTARHRTFHPLIAEWLTAHGFDAVVDDDPDRCYWTTRGRILVTNKKLGAACYIDDRAIEFGGDWTAALATARHRMALTPATAAQGERP
ncbi:hypothetical protein [Kitasatospora cheerisanensis]|uniref:Uncharacterized protein n=1 Tax=Kitasatospora cheerisanensis KCTC 2395 TaxID=1348663 RepID=A0A066YQY5_9ACTN|nr:hypothetical protein [Kitasatospora cheerisanensis]KDN80501.1 hypothetical protein KCH_77350 [Kitasatospora cheerisanensis KCTC 2395]